MSFRTIGSEYLDDEILFLKFCPLHDDIDDSDNCFYECSHGECITYAAYAVFEGFNIRSDYDEDVLSRALWDLCSCRYAMIGGDLYLCTEMQFEDKDFVLAYLLLSRNMYDVLHPNQLGSIFDERMIGQFPKDMQDWSYNFFAALEYVEGVGHLASSLRLSKRGRFHSDDAFSLVNYLVYKSASDMDNLFSTIDYVKPALPFQDLSHYAETEEDDDEDEIIGYFVKLNGDTFYMLRDDDGDLVYATYPHSVLSKGYLWSEEENETWVKYTLDLDNEYDYNKISDDLPGLLTDVELPESGVIVVYEEIEQYDKH